MGRKGCVYHCVKKRKNKNSAALKKATEARMRNRLNRVEEDSTLRRDDVPLPGTSEKSDSIIEIEKEHVVLNPGADELMDLSDSTNDYIVDGNRIIDFQYFWSQLLNISEHSEKFGCKLNYLKIEKEKQVGLVSKLDLKCMMCGSSFVLKTSETDTTEQSILDLNAGAVSGAIITGIGLSNLNKITASMDLPTMPFRLYSQTHMEKMLPKLTRFYQDCVLPEIIDPRKARSMPLRQIFI